MNARRKIGGNSSMPHGFSLIEVLVAVVVLSLGLLSLAALQGALVRGGSAAKAQTQAMALAQQTLEQFRGFKTKTGTTDSYEAIVAGSDSVAIGANTYDRTVTVDRYQYQANATGSGGTFQPVTNDTTAVAVGINEFKQVTVDVSWTDETGATRTVQEGDVISVAAPADSLSALASPATAHQGPKVYIDPSKFAAGVIPIALGNNQSAAASDPQPESFSTGHITTRFSVQNYSTADTSNGFDLLQKQFDFALTSCTCTQNGTSSSATPSYGPTYWNGSKYIAPSTIVGKQMGDDVVGKGKGSSEDPVLCNACCRDHHDIASTTDQPYPVKYDPFRPDTEYDSGDHKHYDTQNNVLQTTAVATTAGTEYYETCRFVRVDGVNYVSTDARQENHILIAPISPITITSVNKSCDPTGDSITGGTCQDHTLDSTTSKTTYPNFVIDYVTSFYDAWKTADAAGNYPLPAGSVTPGVGDQLVASNGSPSTLATKYSSLINAPSQTSLTLTKGSTQLLEGRGIYIDYIGAAETKAALACVGQTSDPDCLAYSSLSALQVLPFVAVNLTNLDTWGPTTTSSIISVTDASIPSGGTYDPFIIGYTFDRGTVSATGVGTDNAVAQSRLGNAGIIDSLTISPSYPHEAFNCVAGGSGTSQSPCSADPPASGFSYDTSSSTGTRFNTDQQPYTVTTGAAITNSPFYAKYTDNSVSGNTKSNFNSGSIALTVTTPSLSPSTLQNCTLGSGNKQPYTCYSDTDPTHTTVVLQFAGYNSQVSCKPSKTVTCPSPAAVNDYKICSITGVPANVTATIGTVQNAGCYSSGDPTGCTANELTPVTLTFNTSSTTVAAILASMSSAAPLTANFYAQSATCP